jgi:Ca2+-binding EF-hand superfamily protein
MHIAEYTLRQVVGAYGSGGGLTMDTQSIQGAGFQGFMSMMQSFSLTDEQKESLQEIISQYDPENMTAEDHAALREALRTAGIPPTRETFQIMEEAGFERPEGPPPAGGPKPPATAQGDEEEENYFLELLEQLQNGEITEEEFKIQLGQLIEESTDTVGVVFDFVA